MRAKLIDDIMTYPLLRAIMRISSVLGIAMLLAFCASPASAALMYGVAVNPGNTSNAVGIQTNTTGTGPNNITYFIPLGGSSVTYGVNDGGMSSDYGSGLGYNDADALYMYMKYDISALSQTVTSSSVAFDFVDLDLIPINDPHGFFESVRFTALDIDGNPFATTDVIKNADVTGASPTIDMTITHGGNNDPMNITFSGSTLNDLINNLRTAKSDEMIWLVQYGSKYTSNAGNTPEYAMSSAAAYSVGGVLTPVPEPTTLAIWSLLGGVGFIARRRRRKPKTA